MIIAETIRFEISRCLFVSMLKAFTLILCNKMEAISFRVLQFKYEFRQLFRQMHFWACNLSSMIPFPLNLFTLG